MLQVLVKTVRHVTTQIIQAGSSVHPAEKWLPGIWTKGIMWRNIPQGVEKVQECI